jgi:hypothetical protein
VQSRLWYHCLQRRVHLGTVSSAQTPDAGIREVAVIKLGDVSIESDLSHSNGQRGPTMASPTVPISVTCQNSLLCQAVMHFTASFHHALSPFSRQFATLCCQSVRCGMTALHGKPSHCCMFRYGVLQEMLEMLRDHQNNQHRYAFLTWSGLFAVSLSTGKHC